VSEEERDPFEGLSEKDKLFVEAICAGLSNIEAARAAGSEATTKSGLASLASRWRKRPDIDAAIRALRAQLTPEGDGLWDLAMKALREILMDKGNPGARAKAIDTLARILGKLQPERHEHLHAHIEIPPISTPEGRAELVRLVRVTLRALPPDERRAIVREATEGEDEAGAAA